MNSYVFVIGAGASEEFGMPLGHDLKELIATALRVHPNRHGTTEGSADILNAFDHLFANSSSTMESLDLAARAISDAMPTAESIDNYVHQHRNNPEIALCAKLAITDCILKKERSSTLMPMQHAYSNKKGVNFRGMKDPWMLPFFMLITKGATVEELPERFSNITLVVFNYDRCVEHFLHSALVNHYRITPQDATEIMVNLTILHPYGYVGNLPWMDGDIETIPYGHAPNTRELIAVSHRIRTFTESVDRNDRDTTVGRIRNAIAGADRLVFLGFAFDDLNMELLTPPKEKPNARGINPSRRKIVYGTAYMMSPEDKEAVIKDITYRFPAERIRLLDEKDTSRALFDKLSRALKIRE